MTEKTVKTEHTAMDLPVIQSSSESLIVQDNKPVSFNVFRPDDIPNDRRDQIRQHCLWLDSIRKEYPMPATPYRIGVYIRFFNQTKYDDYLDRHKEQFRDTIALCPLWTLVDFYVDNGPAAPNMENAPEWCRLLNDCFDGKVNLIITQKVSNVSRKAWDLTLIARMLAIRNIGIYFISEDIFTTASYYRQDLLDTDFCSASTLAIPEDVLDDECLIFGGQDVE